MIGQNFHVKTQMSSEVSSQTLHVKFGKYNEYGIIALTNNEAIVMESKNIK